MADMADIDWKLLPTGLWTSPAVFAEVGNLFLQAFTDDGVYEVDAGGRRLKILQKLAAEGVIDADHPVPCKIENPDDVVETSIAENTVRAVYRQWFSIFTQFVV
jgi:hypothetical protein